MELVGSWERVDPIFLDKDWHVCAMLGSCSAVHSAGSPPGSPTYDIPLDQVVRQAAVHVIEVPKHGMQTSACRCVMIDQTNDPQDSVGVHRTWQDLFAAIYLAFGAQWPFKVLPAHTCSRPRHIFHDMRGRANGPVSSWTHIAGL